MADLYADVENPLENPDLIALGTVLTGAGFALGGTMLAQATLLRDASNYRVTTVFDDMFAPMVLFGLLFLLGCYVGASAFWVFSARKSDIVPLRLAFGAVTFGLAGFALMLLLGTVLPIGRPIAASGTLLAAYYGARFTTVLRRPKPESRGLRLGRSALTASALLIAILLVSYKPSGFPGAQAPIAERHAWAERTFGEPYRQAVDFAKTCPDLSERFGAIRAVGPAPGTNVVYQAPGQQTGDFTLEVVGAAGAGLVHGGVVLTPTPKASPFWVREGEVLVGDRAVPLECR